MQVRKFEARTMKEALDMIRKEMGPEAIILSAKDHSRSFGLVGQGSVEVTAGVTAATLKKKQFVESRLKESEKQLLQNSTAKAQKTVIQSMINKYEEKHKENLNKAALSKGTRYIDIQESEETITNENVSKLQDEIRYLKNLLQTKNEMPNFIPDRSEFLGALQEHFEKLKNAGIRKEIAIDILNQIKKENPAQALTQKSFVQSMIAKSIMNQTLIADQKTRQKTHVFFGPSGAGKTSTVIKLAAHKIIFEQASVAIISCDSKKVGAFEQTKLYAQILNVPFAGVRDVNDLGKHMKNFSSFDYILVDMPACKLNDLNEISLFNQFLFQLEGCRKHLILSAVMKDSDLTEIGKKFRVLKYDDTIFTGLDLAAEHGNVFNFTLQFNTPIYAFGIGASMPEDFEYASKERMLDLIFKLTKIRKDHEVDI